jgi:DNA-binding NarL/FixJ family response regulator
VTFDAGGKFAKPPADSKYHTADVSDATKPKPYRRRRSSRELALEVVDLAERGLVVTAIANQLNVADRRVKTILAQAVPA